MAAVAGRVSLGVEFDVRVRSRGHLLFGDGGVGVGEHVGEGEDVLELWGESCADDVIRGGHAFDCVWDGVSIMLEALEFY